MLAESTQLPVDGASTSPAAPLLELPSPASPTPRDSLPPVARWGDGVGDVISAVLSPDGEHVYFTVKAEALSGVVLFNAAAPYVAGLVGLLALMVLVLAVRRVVQRPQKRGRAYCRRCNYNLTGSPVSAAVDGSTGTAGKCSECGVDLAKRPPRGGRRAMIRLVPALAACVIISAASASLLRAPRWSGPALKRVGLSLIERSPTLESVLSPTFLAEAARPAMHLCVARSAGVTHEVLSFRTMSYSDLTIAPDGRSLFLCDDDDDFVQLDAQTAAVLRVAPLRGRTLANVQVPSIIGFSSDGKSAYVQWAEVRQSPGAQTPRKCGVSLWLLDQNEVQDLVVTNAWQDRGSPAGWPSNFGLVDAGSDWRVIEWPNFMQAYSSKKWTLRAHTAAGSVDLATVPGVESSGVPALSVHKRCVFVPRSRGLEIAAIGVDDGVEMGTLQSTSRQTSMGWFLTYCESREWLGVGSIKNQVRVRDVRNKQWVVELAAPEDCFGLQPSFSSDGSRLLVIAHRNVSKPKTIQGATQRVFRDLLVWDLRSIPEATNGSDKTD